jgi:hypothetical protein
MNSRRIRRKAHASLCLDPTLPRIDFIATLMLKYHGSDEKSHSNSDYTPTKYHNLHKIQQK